MEFPAAVSVALVPVEPGLVVQVAAVVLPAAPESAVAGQVSEQVLPAAQEPPLQLSAAVVQVSPAGIQPAASGCRSACIRFRILWCAPEPHRGTLLSILHSAPCIFAPL